MLHTAGICQHDEYGRVCLRCVVLWSAGQPNFCRRHDDSGWNDARTATGSVQVLQVLGCSLHQSNKGACTQQGQSQNLRGSGHVKSNSRTETPGRYLGPLERGLARARPRAHAQALVLALALQASCCQLVYQADLSALSTHQCQHRQHQLPHVGQHTPQCSATEPFTDLGTCLGSCAAALAQAHGLALALALHHKHRGQTMRTPSQCSSTGPARHLQHRACREWFAVCSTTSSSKELAESD